jgi:dTDP-4-dehydrorhamnose reductase
MTATKHFSVLQFGATGQLAHALRIGACNLPHLSLHILARDRADFRYPDQVRRAVRESGAIDLVINATAYTAVDRAESEPDLARTVNAGSVGALAEACAARSIPLIHVSTDYVFDGSKGAPYTESDSTRPLSAYGRTKLEGENAIRNCFERHVIVRTSQVYSAQRDNFVKTVLRLGAEQDEIRVVTDQLRTPTSAASLATSILAIAGRVAHDNEADPFGTFHYADQGETTVRRFAEVILEDAAPWASLKAKAVPIAAAQYQSAAQRPLDSRLDCAKFERVFAIARPHWRQSLARVLDEIRKVTQSDSAGEHETGGLN